MTVVSKRAHETKYIFFDNLPSWIYVAHVSDIGTIYYVFTC
jgi:hypothetical protein